MDEEPYILDLAGRDTNLDKMNIYKFTIGKYNEKRVIYSNP